MEHANSTAMGVYSDEYLPSVAAHEFFHLWNVKRIRPASLEPVDYTKEQYTRALWFAEGVTNTYGSYTLVRSGIWSKEQFYADLGEQITELEGRPANHWQSAEQSSLDAWLEKYPLYNQPEDVVLNWNGDEVPKRVEHWLQEQKAGDLLKLRVRRDDKDISFEFRLGEIKETLYQVIEDSHADEKARGVREGMLRGETSAVAIR